MEPLPTLSRALHLVQQAEKQKQIMEGPETMEEANAFAVNGGSFHGKF